MTSRTAMNILGLRGFLWEDKIRDAYKAEAGKQQMVLSYEPDKGKRDQASLRLQELAQARSLLLRGLTPMAELWPRLDALGKWVAQVLAAATQRLKKVTIPRPRPSTIRWVIYGSLATAFLFCVSLLVKQALADHQSARTGTTTPVVEPSQALVQAEPVVPGAQKELVQVVPAPTPSSSGLGRSDHSAGNDAGQNAKAPDPKSPVTPVASIEPVASPIPKIDFGWLLVRSRPWARVRVDEEKLVEDAPFLLLRKFKQGRHRLTMVSKADQKVVRVVRDICVEPGCIVLIDCDFEEGIVCITHLQ